jgi:hypothetical protein
MRPHLAQITVIADVIADATLIHIRVSLPLTGKFLDPGECVPNRAGVFFSTPDVINFAYPGSLAERQNEAHHIFGVDIVAYLLAPIIPFAKAGSA